MKESLLLLARDPARRLRLVAQLARAWEVHLPLPGEEPLRALRRLRPRLVLLLVDEGRGEAAIATLRALRTEGGSPPPIALLDPYAELRDHPLPDGLFVGEAPAEALLALLAETAAGQRPRAAAPPARRSLLRRLLGPA